MCADFIFLHAPLCADFRLCLSRRAVVIIRRRKEINDEPSLSNSRQTACITSHKFELSRHGLVAVSHLLITSDEHKLRLLASRPARTLLPALESEAKLKNLVYADVQTACCSNESTFQIGARKISNFFPPSIVQKWLCQSPRTVARLARTENLMKKKPESL